MKEEDRSIRGRYSSPSLLGFCGRAAILRQLCSRTLVGWVVETITSELYICRLGAYSSRGRLAIPATEGQLQYPLPP